MKSFYVVLELLKFTFAFVADYGGKAITLQPPPRGGGGGGGGPFFFLGGGGGGGGLIGGAPRVQVCSQWVTQMSRSSA